MWYNLCRMSNLGKCTARRYLEIADELCADIRAGKYRSRRSFPSLTMIMHRFGVARATAAKCVDELKHRGVVAASPRSGITARNTSRTIGLILPGVAYSEFFPPIMSGISQRCQDNGYSLLFGDVYSKRPDVRAQQAKALAESFAQKHVAGVIFQPISFVSDATRINKEIVAILSDAGIPVVLIDYDIVPPPERSAFDLVGINNFDAGRRLAAHLIAVGAKNIHFLMYHNCAASGSNRLEGANFANFQGGHKCSNILQADPEDVAAVRAYLKKHRPDAIICGNDTIAAFLKHTLDALGKRVPEDIMLAGFDDVQFASVMTPQLTTIHQPCDEIAAMAFRALQERIADPSLPPREIYLPAPLVMRKSTAREMTASASARKSLKSSKKPSRRK